MRIFTKERRRRSRSWSDQFVKSGKLTKSGTPRKKPVQHEHREQVELFAWAWNPETWAEFPELEFLYACPNGDLRTPYVMLRLKAAGLKGGVFDTVLPAARGGYHGLYLEMKWGKNKLDEDQIKFRDFLIRQNYKPEVCYSADQAKAALITYLRLPRTQVIQPSTQGESA